MIIFVEVFIQKHSRNKANVTQHVAPSCPDKSLICALSQQHPLIHNRMPKSEFR